MEPTIPRQGRTASVVVAAVAVAVAQARTWSLPFLDDDHDWLAGSLGELSAWSPFGSFLPTERLAWSALAALVGAHPTAHRVAFALAWVGVAVAWAGVARRVGASPLAAAALGALVVTHPALPWTWGWLSCWAYAIGALGLAATVRGALDVVDGRPAGGWTLPLGAALAIASKEVTAVGVVVPLGIVLARRGARDPLARRALLGVGLVAAAWALAFVALHRVGVWITPVPQALPLGARLASPLALAAGVPPWSWWTLLVVLPVAAVDRDARGLVGWSLLGLAAHVVAMALVGVRVPPVGWGGLVAPTCHLGVDPLARYAFVAVLWSGLALAGAVAAVQRRWPRATLGLAAALLASALLSAGTAGRCADEVLGMAAVRERARDAWADAALDALAQAPPGDVAVAEPAADARPWTEASMARRLVHRALETGRPATDATVARGEGGALTLRLPVRAARR